MNGSLTLPTQAQTLDADERLEVLKKVGLGTPMTDLAVITGGYISSLEVGTGEFSDYLGPASNQHSALYMTRSATGVGTAWGVYDNPVFKTSDAFCFDPGATKAVIRPMMATNFISFSPKETYTDEELEKMIKYQQAYNAASRYINVVSQMLEHLVTSLGNA